ncbi:MAG: ester cyclase [Gemmatimonadota bacterium]
MTTRVHSSFAIASFLPFALWPLVGCNGGSGETGKDAEAVVQRLAAAWNTQDLGGLETVFAPDAVQEDVTSGAKWQGLSEIRASYRDTWQAIPDVQTEVTQAIVAGEWIAWEWTMTATHTGDFPDLPATGRRFTLRGVSISRVRDGKILSQRDYYDQATFLRQVGAFPGGS